MQSNDEIQPVIINNCQVFLNIHENRDGNIIDHRIVGEKKNAHKAAKYLISEGFAKPKERIDLVMD